MRNSLIILLLLIFVCCSSTKNLTDNDVIGKYKAKSYYEGNAILTLKKDNTFEYDWRKAGLIAGTTSGTWKREKNKIILNSEIQKSEDYEVIRTDNKESDSITVKVSSSMDNLPLPIATYMLKSNGKIVTAVSTNIDGIAVLPRAGADSLQISYIGHITIQHKLGKDITYYEFRMKEDFWYEYFTNDIWIYKNDKLKPKKRKGKYLKISNPK